MLPNRRFPGENVAIAFQPQFWSSIVDSSVHYAKLFMLIIVGFILFTDVINTDVDYSTYLLYYLKHQLLQALVLLH